MLRAWTLDILHRLVHGVISRGFFEGAGKISLIAASAERGARRESISRALGTRLAVVLESIAQHIYLRDAANSIFHEAHAAMLVCV